METDLINLGIGSKKRKLKVLNVEEEIISFPDKYNQDKMKEAPKVFLNCESIEGMGFRLDEAVVKDRKGLLKKAGLWKTLDASKKLNSDSTLAKMLAYYDISMLGEMIGMEIYAYPKPNNFLVVVACDFEEKDLNWT